MQVMAAKSLRDRIRRANARLREELQRGKAVQWVHSTPDLECIKVQDLNDALSDAMELEVRVRGSTFLLSSNLVRCPHSTFDLYFFDQTDLYYAGQLQRWNGAHHARHCNKGPSHGAVRGGCPVITRTRACLLLWTTLAFFFFGADILCLDSQERIFWI